MSPAPESVYVLPPRIVRLRIRGFRSYGTEAREMELDSPITVIKGDNSQGKTATAEALEFLFTGTSSRRDLFGGAKAEYERMLANVHLPEGDTDVWVEAEIRCADGVVRTVRRTLTADYSASADCASTVMVDSQVAADLDSLGFPFGDPPLAAPVLLQHNLRYVLSTEPQKRAAYFRSLLELTDLDIVREAVSRSKKRVADLPSLPWVAALSTLCGVAQENASAAAALGKAASATDQPTLTKHLVAAAKAFSPSVSGTNVDDVIAGLQRIKAHAEEEVFPIGALMPKPARLPAAVDTTRLERSVGTYIERLRSVDAEVARLTPIFNAVLNHPHLRGLSEPTSCPVCEDGTLRPQRIAQLREQLTASGDMQEAAGMVAGELQRSLQEIDRIGSALRSVLPEAHAWDEKEWAEAAAHRDTLRDGDQVKVLALNSEDSAGGMVSRAARAVQRLREIRGQVKNLIEVAVRRVGERAAIQDHVSPLLMQVNECIAAVQQEAYDLKRLVDGLHEELGEKLQSATLPSGTREILDLLAHRDELRREQRFGAQRKKAKQRIDVLGRMIHTAEQALLDDRFGKMGSEIDRWWASLRPDELVRFGGVGRRASGRRYVNLTAELAVSNEASPEVRDAVGVFSDSQLNALGLAAFVARQRLLGSPVVVLDDPLPGYDPEHRVTFTLNTLGNLMDDGVQVIVCTHDPKLAVNIVEVQGHRGLEHYELALSDMVEGTTVTNESDVFGKYLLEAQDSIASLTVEGRRNAANALRRAAERLAKQIIATGRTQAATPTRVSEVGDKVLGDLIPEVLGFALGNDERGRWNLWKRCLNPGAHDDDVPLAPTLRTVFGDIKRLKKNHEAHWTGGLLK
ncbi:AAA family ATPase [Phytoactinopolyspora endophytica]|uniref:AAA family ATPase n=1 Tax=Phytoactinopolyspora endophytica TaxID=1642495 RepID=UPI0023EA6F1A|nr:AAA family ATPase [Phytoactinopolyspora endophytica]